MSGKNHKIIVIFSVAGWVLLFLGFVLLWQRFQAYKKADSVFDRQNSLIKETNLPIQ